MSGTRERAVKRYRQDTASVGGLLWRANRLFERAGDEALARVDLVRSQVVLLDVLRLAPGLSGSELARRAHLSVPGVAVSLVQMERRGWVRRRPHPAHLRLLEVFVTPEGNRRLARAQKALRSVEAKGLKRMSPPQRAALKVALGRLSESLAEGD